MTKSNANNAKSGRDLRSKTVPVGGRNAKSGQVSPRSEKAIKNASKRFASALKSLANK